MELGARCQQGAGECSAPASKAWDSPPLPPEASPRTHSHSSRAIPPSPLPPPSPLHLLELARLAVHTRQQQPGGLADIIAVHRKAAAVAGMRHGHSDPLHQRGQYEEGPAQEEGGGDVLGPSGNPAAQTHPDSRRPLSHPYPYFHPHTIRFPWRPCLEIPECESLWRHPDPTGDPGADSPDSPGLGFLICERDYQGHQRMQC